MVKKKKTVNPNDPIVQLLINKGITDKEIEEAKKAATEDILKALEAEGNNDDE